MIGMLAVVLAGVAGWLWTPFHDPSMRIRRTLRSPPSAWTAGERLGARPSRASPPQGRSVNVALPEAVRGTAGKRRPSRQETVICAAVGLTVFLLVGAVPGAVAGMAGFGFTLEVIRRREPPRLRRERERVVADLPLAADLMVACLRAGQPITGALDITVEAVGGPLGDRLAWVSGQLRLGAAPEDAWRSLAAERSLAPLARTMGRAVLSGAPVADVLTRLADDSRQAARAVSTAAARRVGVQAVAPLGLCFLPAFVLLGIIPTVAGLAGDVLLP